MVFNPFQENTYILYDETKECIIVDAGCNGAAEIDALVNFIDSKGLKPVKLVNTHCHVDHVLGISALVKKYNIPFEAHEKEIPYLEIAVTNGKVYGFVVEQPPMPTKTIKDGDVVKFGNSELKVFDVPGHSFGSVALYSEPDNFVIVGDVLFKGSIGRTDLLGGDYDQLMKSIFGKLMVLDGGTIVFPGHGPETNIGSELVSNPFLT